MLQYAQERAVFQFRDRIGFRVRLAPQVQVAVRTRFHDRHRAGDRFRIGGRGRRRYRRGRRRGGRRRGRGRGRRGFRSRRGRGGGIGLDHADILAAHVALRTVQRFHAAPIGSALQYAQERAVRKLRRQTGFHIRLAPQVQLAVRARFHDRHRAGDRFRIGGRGRRGFRGRRRRGARRWGRGRGRRGFRSRRRLRRRRRFGRGRGGRFRRGGGLQHHLLHLFDGHRARRRIAVILLPRHNGAFGFILQHAGILHRIAQRGKAQLKSGDILEIAFAAERRNGRGRLRFRRGVFGLRLFLLHQQLLLFGGQHAIRFETVIRLPCFDGGAGFRSDDAVRIAHFIAQIGKRFLDFCDAIALAALGNADPAQFENGVILFIGEEHFLILQQIMQRRVLFRIVVDIHHRAGRAVFGYPFRGGDGQAHAAVRSLAAQRVLGSPGGARRAPRCIQDRMEQNSGANAGSVLRPDFVFGEIIPFLAFGIVLRLGHTEQPRGRGIAHARGADRLHADAAFGFIIRIIYGYNLVCDIDGNVIARLRRERGKGQNQHHDGKNCGNSALARHRGRNLQYRYCPVFYHNDATL